MAIFVLVLAVALGFAITLLANPSGNRGPLWAAILLELGLGAAFGIALVSLLFFLLLPIHAASSGVMLPAEMLLFVISAVLLFSHRKWKTVEPPLASPRFRWNHILGGAFITQIVMGVVALARSARINRYGTWDAWAIWNLRAKFLAGTGDTWRRAFSPLLTFSHPDYPPLLSGFIAQVWKFSGKTSPTVPILTAAVFTASVLAVLVSALTLLRGTASGLLGGLLLLTSISFLMMPMSQYADVPLSLYYLGTMVLALLSATSAGSRRAGPAVLAGAFASFAAWTKNEGLVFLILTLACYGVVWWRRTSEGSCVTPWWYLALGSAPVLLLVVYFKMFLVPRVDLAEQTAAQVLHKAGEIGRYWIVTKSLVAKALEFGDWWSHPLLLVAILAVALRFRIDRRQRLALLAGGMSLAFLFLAYCGVYVITPLDLRFHLSTSLARLYGQMWPCFLFLVFLVLARPEDVFRAFGDIPSE